jgi:hypothetical protein
VDDRCTIRGCRAEAGLSYLGHGVCSTHWNELTADDAAPDALRMALGIEATAPAAMEVDMSETKKTETKATKKSKSSKVPKPKREKAPKEDLCVFALRMTGAERAKLHEAAGPGGATRLARAVLIAASNEDESAFKSAIKEAKEARA